MQICIQKSFWTKVKSFQGQGGLVKMPKGSTRHFDRQWATCLGSKELLPWWQSWAGQAAGKKGGPPSVKVAHGYGDWRYHRWKEWKLFKPCLWKEINSKPRYCRLCVKWSLRVSEKHLSCAEKHSILSSLACKEEKLRNGAKNAISSIHKNGEQKKSPIHKKGG